MCKVVLPGTFSPYYPGHHCKTQTQGWRWHGQTHRHQACQSVKKLSIFSKTQCSNVIFFQIFMKNPLLSCPYLVQKKVTSVKTTLQYKPKKSKGCPFFFPRFFTKKISALMPIFCPKNVHSLQNSGALISFFQFLYQKPLLSCPYLVKKTSIL